MTYSFSGGRADEAKLTACRKVGGLYKRESVKSSKEARILGAFGHVIASAMSSSLGPARPEE